MQQHGTTLPSKVALMPWPYKHTAFLRESQVLELLQISRSTLRRWVKADRFPAPHAPSPGVRVWDANEVQEWISRQLRRP